MSWKNIFIIKIYYSKTGVVVTQNNNYSVLRYYTLNKVKTTQFKNYSA